MNNLKRPSAKKHAEIVERLEGSNHTLRLACDRWADGWNVAKAKHEDAISDLKTDIEKIEREHNLTKKILEVAELSIENLEGREEALEDEVELLEEAANSQWELLKEKMTYIRKLHKDIEELAEEIAERMKSE